VEVAHAGLTQMVHDTVDGFPALVVTAPDAPWRC